MPSSSTLSPKIIGILLIPIILLVSLVAASYIFQQPTPNHLDMNLQNIGGTSIDTTSFRGKVLVVEFFATWCDFCQETAGNIASFIQNYKPNNVVFLSVSIDPVHDIDKVLNNFISTNNLTSYVGTNWFFTRDMTEQYTDYGVSTIPNTFLVSNSSLILERHVGLLTTENLISWLNNTQLVGPNILS